MSEVADAEFHLHLLASPFPCTQIQQFETTSPNDYPLRKIFEALTSESQFQTPQAKPTHQSWILVFQTYLYLFLKFDLMIDNSQERIKPSHVTCLLTVPF